PGQRFKLSNCTELICEGNNKVIVNQTVCPPIKEITCANKYPAVLVPDENGCCYHYECQCVCSGWGDPHYITFDGTYYTFLENCTYVLVKQIVPKYDNFRVHIENYYCDSKDGLSCPKSIIIFYKSATVKLTRELLNGVMTNVMYFNNKIVQPGFHKDGIYFSTLGINMIVEIPEIGATITFSGLIFSVKLPYSKFGNNTEGQCGTCTNNKKDECRLPSAYNCPANMVYKPCGSINPATCSQSQEKNGQKIARNVSVTDLLSECIVQNTNVLCHSKYLVLNQDTCLFRHRYQKIHAVPGLSAVRHGCVVNETYYAPGTVIPSGPCESCTCSKSSYSSPQKFAVKCQPVTCDTYCPVGYKYTEEPGKCCGTCKAEACIVVMEDNTTHVLKIGKFWSPPGNNCTTYTCEKYNGQFITVISKKSCPAFNPDLCEPDSIRLSDDGCCRVCSIPPSVSSEVKIIQQTSTNPVITPSNPAHNGRVCSTWGNFHFKTFDGDIFYYPGLCNYVFASHCNAPYEEFNIQIRRTLVENIPTIHRIAIKLEGVAVELTKDVVLINSNKVQLPYSQAGITIERSSIYVKVVSKADIVFMWNQRDSILLELHEKYANQTCGLCGDFNGIPVYNEFYSNNIRMTALQFGNMQKMDGPTEYCEDPTPSPPDNCTYNFDDICQKTLTSFAFADCNGLVNVSEYIMACQEDLCRSEELKNASCICDTIAEYSRQCAHAGGEPLNWRTSKLCPKTCPYNMQYSECSSPCTDTCTNPERSQFCEEHCMDGCFCPQGTVFDDINNSGCISRQQCSCIYNGNTYAPGTSFSEQCHSCTCNGGKWNCEDMSCPGICSVEGGSHISTYDKKHYDVYGDCTYVLSKHCEDEIFTILVELRKCGMTNTETCLRTVTLSLNKGQTLIEVKTDGGVFVNSIYTQLPISAANVTIFRPSSFFIIMHTNIGIQVEIQITPIMQMFVRLDPVFKDQTCGLCGNFNNVQTDDFKAISGVIEGTAAAFANTWKTQASCPDIQNSFENPCALSIDNEKYAQHWCGLLTNREGPFADCHYLLNPSTYYTNCMFDTCNCQNSEGCLCAALSSYVRACAARGIQINGWRTNVCSKYSTSCPKSLSYSYTIDSCQPTCRSLSEPDVTCKIKFVPVDGCTCINGTYMDESGKCVPANECPCYYRGSPIPLGEVVRENGLVCTCIQGRLNCIGEPDQIPVCESPMFYLDCRNNTAGTTGSECQKSCQTLDMQCYSTQCVSGCVCPSGLVLDGKGGCIPEEECPCIHNGAMYQPGEKINADCNTCVCKDRMWECTKKQCLGTCAVYGDGHYTTFDDQRFSFNGNCEYTLVQNHCGKSDTVNGTFQVISENIPCGSTGTTCSKSIKVFLEHYELILSEERVSVIKRGQSGEVPFTVRYIGMYTVIDTTSGLILMWDKKTSIFIKLSPEFKGQICGLCGNYDGNGINDFTTRSLSVVENVLEFGNSWKVSSTCPDANFVKDPCSTNPYRKSWSEKQCSIINSNVFAACHSQVEPARYYQACVTDACACDSGGDCDCFCTAVAAYAQACNEVGVCIAWRTPSICPLFCDYYNQQGECEWHYKPCGASCMKTCKNPSGKCLHNLPGLEGCYPNCPSDKPYFHEDQMKCVSLCDCYDNEDGKIYMRDKCQLCECTSEGLQCKFDDKGPTIILSITACNCVYENNTYKYNELIYNTTDGSGWCFRATCDVNGTINRNIFECGITTPSTVFTFSTSQPTTGMHEMATTTPAKSVCVKYVCEWSEWYDGTELENEEETFQNVTGKGKSTCNNMSSIECRVQEQSNKTINYLNQKIQCNKTTELKCNNEDQEDKKCYNYQIRLLCCNYVSCSEITTTPPRQTQQTTSTPTETTTVPIQTKIKPTTTHIGTKPQEKEITTISTPTSSASTTKTSVHPTESTTTIASTTAGTTTPTTSASTTKTTPPSTEETTTISSTSAGTTTPTSSASTTKTTPLTTGSTTTITTSTTTAITTTLPPRSCQPRCTWTQWCTTTISSTTAGTSVPTSSGSTTTTSPPPTKSTTTIASTSARTTVPSSSASTTKTTPPGAGTTTTIVTTTPSVPSSPTSPVTTLSSTSAIPATSPTEQTQPTAKPTTVSPVPTSSETTTTSTTGFTRTTSPLPTGPTTITSGSTIRSVPPPTRVTTTMSSTGVQSTIPSSTGTTVTAPVPESTATTILTPAQTTAATSSSATPKISPILTGHPTTIATSPNNSASTTKTSPSGTEFTIRTSTRSPPSSSTIVTPTAVSTIVTQTIAQSPTSSHSAGTSQPSLTTSTSAVSSSSPTTPSTTEASGTTPCFCHVLGGLFSPGKLLA
ncbi:mucin-5AC-like, partial [Phasianus colchicus]|uniref:mucin-5AC-like n=1 Tax=Phasianus colchicus TaxID=9054 RepID=UPI00129E169E